MSPPSTSSHAGAGRRTGRLGDAAARPLAASPEPVAEIESARLSLGRRGHSGAASTGRRGAAGTILFIHGGGWVVGSLDTHDGSCRHARQPHPAERRFDRISQSARASASPPPSPIATQVSTGCCARVAAMGLDTSRLVLCGESAGGKLAAVLAHPCARSRHPPRRPGADLSGDRHGHGERELSRVRRAATTLAAAAMALVHPPLRRSRPTLLIPTSFAAQRDEPSRACRRPSSPPSITIRCATRAAPMRPLSSQPATM